MRVATWWFGAKTVGQLVAALGMLDIFRAEKISYLTAPQTSDNKTH